MNISHLAPAAALLLSLAVTAAHPVAAVPPAGYTLSWSEEFGQKVGAPPDPAVWNYDLGGNGWDNGELETYVADTTHAHIIADPAATDGKALQIQALSDGQGHFTSARINTGGKITAQYGYVEARIRVPHGRGIWPAFWMLGSDIGSAGWPRSGEIDIMENIGREPSIAHGSLHGPGYSGGQSKTGQYTLPNGQKLSDDYHLFGMLWAKDSITFSVDGVPYETRTPADLPPGAAWAYNHPFFFVLNVAVGGRWPGKPDATTVLPQTMRVDYIRVYTPPVPKP